MRSGFPAHAGQSCRRREIIRLDVAGARARPDLPAVDTRRAADAVGLRGGRRGGDGVRAQRPYTQIRCADQRERRRHRPGLGTRPAPADAERHRRGFACWRRRRSGISVRAVGERGGARRVGWRRPGRPRTGAAAGGGLRLRSRRADPRRPCRRAIRPARGAGPVRLGPRQYPCNCRSPLPWLWRRGFAETTFAVRCAYLTNWLMERKTRHERRGNDDAYDRSAGGRGGPRQADRPADGRRRRRRSRCTGHVGGQRFAPGP